MIHTPPGSWPTPGHEYLQSSRFLDSAHPAVHRFAWSAIGTARTKVEKAVTLFYRVRDGWRYDPYSVRLAPKPHTASHVLTVESAYCIQKAILLAAAARAVGIPAALGFSDVENHLSTEKLKAAMGGKTVVLHHGYALLLLGGRWVRAAPAFNIELCRRFGVRPTEFDGRSDAVLQQYDAKNRLHMEYRRDHGYFSDFPAERVFADLRAAYPAEFFTGGEPPERFDEGHRAG
ncbi:MAG TPA: transglutaminase family protein [Anaeromyxobacter sp.]